MDEEFPYTYNQATWSKSKENITKANQQLMMLNNSLIQSGQGEGIVNVQIKSKLLGIASKRLISEDNFKVQDLCKMSLIPEISKFVMRQTRQLLQAEIQIDPYTLELMHLPDGTTKIIDFINKMFHQLDLLSMFNHIMLKFQQKNQLRKLLDLSFSVCNFLSSNNQQTVSKILWNDHIQMTYVNEKLEEDRQNFIITKLLIESKKRYNLSSRKQIPKLLLQLVAQKKKEFNKSQQAQYGFFAQVNQVKDYTEIISKALDQQQIFINAEAKKIVKN